MIKWELKRTILEDKYTIGSLYREGVFMCHTLEDKVRPTKIPKITAIPYGTYQIIFNFSNKFQQYMPLLLEVPNYEGIRIHAGNTEVDTEGCILVGEYTEKYKKMIINSRKTLKKIEPILRKDTRTDKVYITIS